jgi:hypothetical protein
MQIQVFSGPLFIIGQNGEIYRLAADLFSYPVRVYQRADDCSALPTGAWP